MYQPIFLYSDILDICLDYALIPIKKFKKFIDVDKIDWCYLSINPAAIHILEKNLDKVRWEYLLSNPAAIHILEKNLDKIDFHLLSNNPAAIHILEKNLDKVEWY